MTEEQWQATNFARYTHNHASIEETQDWISRYGWQLRERGEDSSTVESWQSAAEIEWAGHYAQLLFERGQPCTSETVQTVLVQGADDYIVVDRCGENDGWRFSARDMDWRLPEFLARGRVIVIDWETLLAMR